ncbi:diaminopimelate decarboxylase [Angomonas deanei]|nr:diaminopimelate decarboxylase [Angomonas deanei]CAD2222642.1 Pyridoxal-dependent decarboxylase, pyridoxal binding domain/Pyridoxal-dependent decarboxylase, C-terminal sheet domain containing protein, putative [Angomonas deanei]|eukprot:EPY17224.1 diaminopimelate decarboxylase [Angomonas deanei]
MGLETASIGEFILSERVLQGSHQEERRIVFDSPAKTIEEVYHALQVKCYLNVDNFQELDRIIEIQKGAYKDSFPPLPEIKAIVGIRVNPQTVQSASNALLATGGAVSKFGVSLHDEGNMEKILQYVEQYHDTINLTMLHVHSGSQGLSLDTMVAGVRTIVSLAEHERIKNYINVIDIGGGFPVDFTSDEETLTIADYARELSEKVPQLFRPDGRRTILTEFGRSLAAKSGILISRVEYVKQSGGRQIISQHIGADLAVRTVWQPSHWPLRVRVYDEEGNLRQGEEHGMRTDVAGPCCNSGCMLTREAPLPLDVKPLRDLIVVHDVGGYYHSSFSLYNLRQMCACYAYREGEEPSLTCVKHPQSVEETIRLFQTDA